LLLLAASEALARQGAAIAVSVVADTNRFVGRVEAIERVDARAGVTGFLEKILFTDGDNVSQ
jgi:membrane fusion protein, multidrug efflux system